MQAGPPPKPVSSLHAGVVQQLEPDALLLADGRRVPAQVLVWAIGYDKGYACLAGLEGCLNKQPDGLHLYRNMIPVDLPVGPTQYIQYIPCWEYPHEGMYQPSRASWPADACKPCSML